MKKQFGVYNENIYEQHIVSAEAGYFVLDRVLIKETDTIKIRKIPVIAWSIKVFEDDWKFVEPITYERISDLWQEEILTPQGAILRREFCIGSSSDETLQAFSHVVAGKDWPIGVNKIETAVANRTEELHNAQFA